MGKDVARRVGTRRQGEGCGAQMREQACQGGVLGPAWSAACQDKVRRGERAHGRAEAGRRGDNGLLGE